MLSKKFIFHEACRKALFKGIELMYNSVSATLGPHGRTILIEKVAHTMEATKDGVTVANDVYSPEKWEDMGMQLVREASQKANTQAGDATTTAVVLAYWMCKDGMDAVARRANVYQISKGIKKAVDAAVEKLKTIAKTITTEEDFRKVATISTQDEDIGKIIAKTFVDAGTHGSIDIETQDDPGIKSEKTEGLSFDKGWSASIPFTCYINDLQRRRCVNEDVPVLVVENRIENENQLVPIMEWLVFSPPPNIPKEDFDRMVEERNGWPFGIRKLLVVCDDFSGSAIALLNANNKMNPETKGRFFHLMFSKAPSYGVHKINAMKDICAVTGGNFISSEHGGKRVEYATLADLGRAKKVIIEEKRTIITADPTDDRKTAVQERITFIKSQLEEMSKDNLERWEWENRLATLTDGISLLKVGAESLNERHELRRRVEDGVRAVRSAREEGVTPGCGIGLLQCVPVIDKLLDEAENDDQRAGMLIVRKAMHAVTLRLLEVAFVEDFSMPIWKRMFVSPQKQRTNLVYEMKKHMESGSIDNCGYDFKNDRLFDMMNLGIFDAKKAVRVALQASASVATTFLKIDGALGEIKEADEVLGDVQNLLLRR